MTVQLAPHPVVLTFETVTPSPSPTDVLRGDLNEYDVTPGLIGFLAIFFIAVVCILGWFSMNRRVRRLRFAERAEAARAGEGEGSADAGSAADQGPTPDRTDG
ncbi:hypothetical protein ATL41_2307 [Flavimobilis soli]|uniref:Uncharacterized protein n=1 Tax=Flavimobilis soli TaxID=442709 RepID=A0A2A9EH33_9MICO|nr:hypothetical protein [Flavimobilis soli]PFG37540.1 hypothetical protein ATL41_2307 [Flavimobilis soli]